MLLQAYKQPTAQISVLVVNSIVIAMYLNMTQQRQLTTKRGNNNICGVKVATVYKRGNNNTHGVKVAKVYKRGNNNTRGVKVATVYKCGNNNSPQCKSCNSL